MASPIHSIAPIRPLGTTAPSPAPLHRLDLIDVGLADVSNACLALALVNAHEQHRVDQRRSGDSRRLVGRDDPTRLLSRMHSKSSAPMSAPIF
jgi:hypothetical protein